MNSLGISLIALACLSSGILLGLVLNALLPTHHLSSESKDTIKTGTGLIATMSALVLGFLVSSAKGTFDSATATITQIGAKTILLDNVLAEYGPEATGIRRVQHDSMVAAIQAIWPESQTNDQSVKSLEAKPLAARVQRQIRNLNPTNDGQRALQAQALQLTNDILQVRWMMVEQLQNTLPTIFIVMMVAWLSLLFVSFGLFAPRNMTTLCVLLASAISVAGAIFLIQEMNRPLEGILKVSDAPLVNAMHIIESGLADGKPSTQPVQP